MRNKYRRVSPIARAAIKNNQVNVSRDISNETSIKLDTKRERMIVKNTA